MASRGTFLRWCKKKNRVAGALIAPTPVVHARVVPARVVPARNASARVVPAKVVPARVASARVASAQVVPTRVVSALLSFVFIFCIYVITRGIILKPVLF